VEERNVVVVAHIAVVLVAVVVAHSVDFGLVEGSSFAESHRAAAHSVVVLVKLGLFCIGSGVLITLGGWWSWLNH
jgi:ABC-type transport system involved in cytochrome c biogenesis permease subunit